MKPNLKIAALAGITAIAASTGIAQADAIAEHSRYNSGAPSAAAQGTTSYDNDSATRNTVEDATRVQVPESEQPFRRGLDQTDSALEIDTNPNPVEYGPR